MRFNNSKLGLKLLNAGGIIKKMAIQVNNLVNSFKRGSIEKWQKNQ